MLPQDLNVRRYHEPFLGAGSLFFASAAKVAVLSDANSALIETYRRVRDRPDLVLAYLRREMAAHSAGRYYAVREAYNSARDSAAQAARFIYLNKTCFNGIYRVNVKGDFNVPIGKKKHFAIPSAAAMRAISRKLEGTELHARDYTESMEEVRAGDFVYLDPPYPALNGTAYFAHYTKDRFDDEDQSRLAEVVAKIASRGALFLMSNADLKLTRSLYSRFHITSVPVIRFVSCKKKKHAVRELLIKNY